LFNSALQEHFSGNHQHKMAATDAQKVGCHVFSCETLTNRHHRLS